MRRLTLLSAPVLAAVVAIAPLGPAASAAPPSDYSGTFQLIKFSFGDIVNTGSVNHFEFFSTTKLSGDYQANAANELTCVGYEVARQRSFTCHGTSITTGTLDGKGFTTTSRVSFRCSFDTDLCRGRSITYEGTGALAGTRGVTMFEQVASTGAGTWSTNVTGG